MPLLGFAGLLLLLAQNAAKAEPPPLPPAVHDSNGDVEFFARPRLMTQDEALGRVPNELRHYDLLKMENGKELSRASCTLDENGFRKSSASGRPGKTKHFFLIDGSAAFGDGLGNDETVAYWVNKRSSTYEAYSVGYTSFGLSHAWIRFKEGRLKKQIPFNRGSALLWVGIATECRVFGSLYCLFMLPKFPFVAETAPGEFTNKGTFADAGEWWQRLLIRHCLPSRACSRLLSLGGRGASAAQMATLGRMIDDIEKMYRQQFQVDDFRVAWLDTETLEEIRKYTKANVMELPPLDEEHHHPTPLGARQVADFLFDQKIVN